MPQIVTIGSHFEIAGLFPADSHVEITAMPYVNIRVAGTLSRKQKKKIVKGVTDVISRVADKPRESIIIFIDEDSRENVAAGGVLLADK
ncbi:tautomerase family protein [Thermodesulfobacteriota bacterium B35]